MAEQDPIDRMLQRENAGTARTKGDLAEARQSTSEMARPQNESDDRSGGIVGTLRSLYRSPQRKNTRDSRE
jgi:predicted DNA-binding protein (UPF0278 family)